MKNYWNELNAYEEESSTYGIIPNGTIAKVIMKIKPGNYNDQAQGWVDGYATKSIISGSIFLDVEFTILEGPYAKRKIWGMIGLYSDNGPMWGNMGKAFIKGILNSAKGISPKDTSDTAAEARRIDNFKQLDGIEFAARIDITKDRDGKGRNEIKAAITLDHKDYAEVMGKSIILVNNNINNNRPNWASGGGLC